MSEDRHKHHAAPRHYSSGAEKRKLAKEKEKREQETLNKTRKINEFFSSAGSILKKDSVTSANISNTEETMVVEMEDEAKISESVSDKGD